MYQIKNPRNSEFSIHGLTSHSIPVADVFRYGTYLSRNPFYGMLPDVIRKFLDFAVGVVTNGFLHQHYIRFQPYADFDSRLKSFK